MKTTSAAAFGLALLSIAFASGCAHDGMAWKRSAPPPATYGWNNTNMERYNMADALRAKDPSLTPKQAAEKVKALAPVQTDAGSQANYDAWKRQQQYAEQDAFVSDLEKTQRGD